MIFYLPIRFCIKNGVRLSGCWQTQMINQVSGAWPRSQSSAYCFHQSMGSNYLSMSIGNRNFSLFTMGPIIANKRNKDHLLPAKDSVRSMCSRKMSVNVLLGSLRKRTRGLLLKDGIISRMKFNMGPVSWLRECTSACIIFGLLMCYSSTRLARAEAPFVKSVKQDDSHTSPASFSHGKEVHTDYSVIGIPGDGRCLFRSVAHGACLRSGKPPPNESLQRELADELRALVADELVKRRKETEWFIEGDFDSYVSQIRKSHVWGGEPELLMASHVLMMPITVYMKDEDSGGLISIAEYGQEYGKENPIRVLYHGFGHYDALHVPGRDGRSRL